MAAPKPVIPRGVWVLGFVSLLMDTSSEMIHSLLPLFLVSSLGVSALTVGIIEGIAEATAAITKVFSGVISDHLGKRKPLVLFGYGLAALTKPVFALAPTVGWVVVARFADRFGKGIRGAPRDALIADISPPEVVGASFGLRQSLDTVGAFSGPLIAMGLMLLSSNDYRLVFMAATLPAILTVILIIVGIQEPVDHKTKSAKPIHWSDIKLFPRRYWGVVGIATMMTLARFSEGFLLLLGQSVGLDAAMAPIVLVAMNIVYAASSYPVGILSDRLGRTGLLFAGFAVLIAADLVLAAADTAWMVVIGVALWGLHMGMTQGLLSALVADCAPAPLRGTAFGVFNLAMGVALLLASVIAGTVWTQFGPACTFLAGAGFTVLSLIAFMGWNRDR